MLNLILSIMITATTPSPSAAAALNHPLDGVLKSLSKTSREIDLAAADADADLKAEAGRLKSRVNDLSVEALLAPVKITDKKLSKLGYDIVPGDAQPHTLEARPNSNLTRMIAEGMDMKKEDWSKLLALSAKGQQETVAVRELANGEYSDLLPEAQHDQVISTVASGREESFKRIVERAQRTVDCISYFTQAFNNYGLRPVGTGNAIAWSAEDLNRKFNVSNFAEIPANQKATVAEALQEMIGRSIGFGFTCVSKEAGKFMLAQKASLEK